MKGSNVNRALMEAELPSPQLNLKVGAQVLPADRYKPKNKQT